MKLSLRSALQQPAKMLGIPVSIAWISMGLALGAGAMYLAHRANLAGAGLGESAGQVHESHGEGQGIGGHGQGHAHDGEPGVIHLTVDKLNAAGIKIAPAQHGTMEGITWLTGKVDLNQDRLAHVNSRVTGIVRDVPGRLGQDAKAGDILAVLDSTEVGNAKLDLFEKELAVRFAQVNYNWNDTIYRNTRSLIGALEKETPINDLNQAFTGKAIGEYREQLMSSYARLHQARADYARINELADRKIMSEAERVKAKADLEAAQATYRAWLEQLRFTSERDQLRADQELRKATTTHAVARERLLILGFRPGEIAAMTAALESLEPQVDEQVTLYQIRAPFAGTIVEKHIVLSERIEPDETLFSIADLSSVWVDVDIYEKDFGLLPQVRDTDCEHSHRIVTLRSDAYPDREFKAEVFYTGDVVDETTRTIRLKAQAENPDRALKPGMFVRVGLAGRHIEDVIHVAASALQMHEGKSFVFLQKAPDEFERRDVVLGYTGDDLVEIREGLKQGDPVVVDGAFALKSEMLRGQLAGGGHNH